MYLYVYEGTVSGKNRQKETEELVRKAALLYLKEENIFLGKISGQILRTEKGKPYFKEVPVEFSVSHTGKFWACVFDRNPVGMDIQVVRPGNLKRIMEKYYLPEEKAYVETVGEEGFFQIWARKEAYGKYLGTGVTEEVRTFSTLTGEGVTFIDFQLDDGVKGACCTGEKKELWIRKLKGGMNR